MSTDKTTRPSHHDIFMNMALVAKKRATCDRKWVGAIIVKDNLLVATGYNGSPAGLAHCDDEDHLLKNIEGRDSCIRTLHAESNALDQAGQRAKGGIIYTTVIPCYDCAKRIINAGLTAVYYDEYYNSRSTELVEELFLSANIPMIKWTGDCYVRETKIDPGEGFFRVPVEPYGGDGFKPLKGRCPLGDNETQACVGSSGSHACGGFMGDVTEKKTNSLYVLCHEAC